jgi:hypothetical protein
MQSFDPQPPRVQCSVTLMAMEIHHDFETQDSIHRDWIFQDSLWIHVESRKDCAFQQQACSYVPSQEEGRGYKL